MQRGLGGEEGDLWNRVRAHRKVGSRVDVWVLTSWVPSSISSLIPEGSGKSRGFVSDRPEFESWLFHIQVLILHL